VTPRRVLVPAPEGGWPGQPLAVVVGGAFEGTVRIRLGGAERCGDAGDARTLDSRFRAGVGTVLVPPPGSREPLEVLLPPAASPLWAPVVRIGAPTAVQREDAWRHLLRVAAVAVMLALALASLMNGVASRERLFRLHALTSLGFAWWVMVLSGLWAHVAPILHLTGSEPWLLAALAFPLVGAGLVLLLRIAGLSRGHRWTEALLVIAPRVLLGAGALCLLLPRAWLPVAAVAAEVLLVLVLLGVVAAALAQAARGRPASLVAAACVAPLLLALASALVAPDALARWKIEVLMLGGAWLLLAASVALTLRLGQLRQQRDALRVLAETDELTGLPNRRSGLDQLQHEIMLARARGRPLAVAFLDADHFKAINDTHGHATGDRVLARIAQRVREGVRGGDVVARVGGEEFLVVLPGADAGSAWQRLERVRQRIEEDPEGRAQGLPAITASAGVTLLRPGDRDAAAVLRRADAAMYRAKHYGRNRVELDVAPDGEG
jgi:diguanylate cyclase (GGDEF)-like protein